MTDARGGDFRRTDRQKAIFAELKELKEIFAELKDRVGDLCDLVCAEEVSGQEKVSPEGAPASPPSTPEQRPVVRRRGRPGAG
jgi:hypothetical protein